MTGRLRAAGHLTLTLTPTLALALALALALTLTRRKEGEKYGLVGRHGASSSDEEAHTLLYELIALWRACLQQRGSGHASPRSARAGERAGERAPGGGPGHQRSGSNMSTSSVRLLPHDL